MSPDIFSPDQLRQSVHDTLDQALAAIPPGKSGALLVDGTVTHDGGEARVLLAQRVGKDWQVQVGGEWDGHHVAGKVALAGSWGQS